MTIKERFEPEEWEFLSYYPAMVGAAMSAAGKSGITGTMKEMFASSSAYHHGAERFPHDELVSTIGKREDTSMSDREWIEGLQRHVRQYFEDRGARKPHDLIDLVLEDAPRLNKLLDKKAPESSFSYKTWLLDIAEQVARAAKEGGFLGFGAVEFSDGESEFMDRLIDTLGMHGTSTG
ncbi:hypothetical protein [Pontibacter sp. G13]|uniref:hypothetical protein n=1 Tax=Pontibacter sp. G13 TaxID=3074898 RepID=UPI0028894728|nr:hypothetical protein [Pontibacter sp. G13]WNJ20288.1 hypothetical protein RJD25_07395 [Pontibacter sp. G13]